MSTTSIIRQTRVVTPAAIAGVAFNPHFSATALQRRPNLRSATFSTSVRGRTSRRRLAAESEVQ
jgi:hypothetical protein